MDVIYAGAVWLDSAAGAPTPRGESFHYSVGCSTLLSMQY